MSQHEVMSSTAAEPVGPYPHARRIGAWLYLSGVGSRKRGEREIPGVKRDAGGRIVSYDFEAQCRQCFANVKAVLEDAGASWMDIVDVTTYLTDMKRDFPTYNALWKEHFAPPHGPFPCRTTLEIKSLPTEIAVELKVIAYVKTWA